MSDIEKVRNFIVENFLFGEGDRLTDEISFLENAIMDSTGILELIAFLEETFGIQVEDDELVPENLDSLKNVENYLERKMAEGVKA